MRLVGRAIAGILAATSAAAADLVVVEARGVALKAGQTIKDSEPLMLREGQRVTLIAADGRTIKLTGPHDKPPLAGAGTNEGTSVIAALAALKTQKEARLTQAGVIRNVSLTPLPDPWLADAAQSGSVCVKEGEQIVFWREDSRREEALTLSPSDRSWSAKAVWPAGAERLVVPALFPLKDRGLYVVETAGRQAALTVQIVPRVVAGERLQAAWLVEKGCETQAEAIVRKLPAQ